MKALRLLLLLLLIALQAKLWLGDGGVLDLWELERQIEAQDRENAELRERNQSLDAEVRDLKEGVDAIEERARSEMGMIREGEIFYQIIDAPVAGQEQASSNRNATGR
jgi:cell division protein FtsB